MRVLHLLHHSLPHVSGYAVRSHHVLTGQARLGVWPLAVTSPRHAAPEASVEWIDGLCLLRTPPTAESGAAIGRELRQILRHAARAWEGARAFRPHAIHAHSPATCALAGLLVAQRCGAPFLYEVRDLWEYAAVLQGKFAHGSARFRLARALETWLLRIADGVTPICEGLAEEVIARRRQARGVVVCPNGVDPDRFAPAEPSAAERARWQPTGGPVVAYVGGMQPYEGLPVLVRAFARVARRIPQARLVIAGSGPAAASLAAAVHEQDLGDRVHLAGVLAEADVRSLLRRADLVVYPRVACPTTRLTTPLKPLEAMAMARPVLASDLPALRELIRPGETGELAPAGDDVALAARCVALLRDPERRQRLGEQARAYVLRERRWDETVRRYPPLYEAVCAARRSGRFWLDPPRSTGAVPSPP